MHNKLINLAVAATITITASCTPASPLHSLTVGDMLPSFSKLASAIGEEILRED